MEATPQQEAILNRIEKVLENSSDFLIPLEEMRSQLGDDIPLPLPSAEELKNWLTDDERFDLVSGQGNEITAFSPEALSVAGISTSTKVGLKSRRPSREEIISNMQAQAGRLLESLQKAYDSRPRDSRDAGDIEDRLLELLQRAKNIRDGIKNVSREEEPDNSNQ